MNTAVEAARVGDLGYFERSGWPQALIDSVDEDGRTLLQTASASGCVELVKQLIARSQSKPDQINASDDEGWTPLISAVSSGQTAVASLLISAGANIDFKNSGGRTALHYAASKGNIDIIHLLIEAGAKSNIKDKTGSTPLHRAASTGKTEAVSALLERGKAKLEDADNLGQTPLFVALESGNTQTALFMVTKGADLEAADKEGQTPLSVADSAFKAALQSLRRMEESCPDESMVE